ncbi:tripartite tricarboxylate transporter substrate binding protein [Ramlibacter sp. AW1]|uniref:Tripartite tricarboxylate transporter substrate binding protein n=1 Tax=Ramlibacter aurantiacus TaxID=2801330 RepID=A0A936ZHP9_9BURK|nr:tripartite tricarboxylate transporter substrate binding protein [Ramlibacter aurantiacus]MBL0420062.1 tripartite tricarboxylate transporter substrate binding protein [Ramlibacter aurantiacus]
MKQLRARVRAIATLALCAVALAAHAQQNYPAKPVRIVVPYATGGGSDILARQIATGLQGLWGQGVAVENKAGASGNIGTQDVVRAAGDGYTLLLQNSTMSSNLGVYGKLPYDPAKDLTPIMVLGVTPIALAAHPSLNVSDVKGLAALAKSKPRTLSYGNCGIGTPQHFVMELVKQKTGVDATPVGYKGCSPAVTDVLGGQVPLAIVSANLLAPHAKSGKLKVLGVSSATRYSLLPDTPTFEEQGLKPFDFNIWYALMGPANLPPAVVSKIAADVGKVLQDPRVKENLATAGVEPLSGDAAALNKLIREDNQRYVDLAKSANIKE